MNENNVGYTDSYNIRLNQYEPWYRLHITSYDKRACLLCMYREVPDCLYVYRARFYAQPTDLVNVLILGGSMKEGSEKTLSVTIAKEHASIAVTDKDSNPLFIADFLYSDIEAIVRVLPATNV